MLDYPTPFNSRVKSIFCWLNYLPFVEKRVCSRIYLKLVCAPDSFFLNGWYKKLGGNGGGDEIRRRRSGQKDRLPLSGVEWGIENKQTFISFFDSSRLGSYFLAPMAIRMTRTGLGCGSKHNIRYIYLQQVYPTRLQCRYIPSTYMYICSVLVNNNAKMNIYCCQVQPCLDAKIQRVII